jgi:hypothetical protein
VLQVDIPFQGSAWTPWKRMKKDEKGRTRMQQDAKG